MKLPQSFFSDTFFKEVRNPGSGNKEKQGYAIPKVN
jgi:hypothetical protein